MQYFAHIQNGIVTSIEQLDDGLVPGKDIFTPEIAADMVACGTDVQAGWTYNGTSFAAPVAPVVPPPTKDELAAYTLQKSYDVEIGGVAISGVKVLTDDRSKCLIIGMRMRADKDPTVTEHFYAADGTDQVIDAAAIIAISDAVADHVSACFTTRATTIAAIQSGRITTTAQIDAASWPSNG